MPSFWDAPIACTIDAFSATDMLITCAAGCPEEKQAQNGSQTVQQHGSKQHESAPCPSLTYISLTYLQCMSIQHYLAELLLRFGVFPVVSEEPGGMGAGR